MQNTSHVDPSEGRQFLTPLRAFLAVGLATALAFGLWLATNTTNSPTGSPSSIAASTTAVEKETVEGRLKDLERLLMQAYATHDETLVDHVYTSDSPARAIAFEEIGKLRQDQVIDRTRQTQRTLEVVRLTSGEAELHQTVLVEPKYVHQGEDITRGPRRLIQTVEWVLKKEGGEWLVHDSVITASRRFDN